MAPFSISCVLDDHTIRENNENITNDIFKGSSARRVQLNKYCLFSVVELLRTNQTHFDIV